MTKEYLFDVKLFATVRINATDERAARAKLARLFDCAAVNAGEMDGQPVIFDASLDGSDLVEVDGEPL